MKLFIVLALCVVAAIAAPVDSDKDAQILRYDSDNIGIGEYRNSFETSNGIQQQESGQLKNPGSENEALEVQGSFSWVAPDGVTYTITYIANENGFQPQGAHLPVAA